MNIPKSGSELGPGHHFLFENLHKLLKLLTFSQTNEETVDKMVDTFHPRYTSTKRGVFYFSKTIPLDLRHHYKKSRFIQSLKTKSKSQANRASQVLRNRLEDYWLSLRLKEMQIPAAHLLHSVPSKNLDSTLPSIKDAMELYLRCKFSTCPALKNPLRSSVCA